MQITKTKYDPSSNNDLLLAYVADLELEIDRLRKHLHVLQESGRDAVHRIRELATAPHSGDPESPLNEIGEVNQEFSESLEDLYESPGYHPAHDQVVAIAIRPLIEQVFRWQQRLLKVPRAQLHCELQSEHLNWFPARLRHILDNLISNALKYRDPEKGESRVNVALSTRSDGYEVRISDNGTGMPWNRRTEAFELFYRSGVARPASLGVGVAVVKQLVEQSGGRLTIDSGAGQGSSFVVHLPHYNANDFI